MMAGLWAKRFALTPKAAGSLANAMARRNTITPHGHNHATMADVLHDCEAILCLGMGWRAAEALKACGIEPLMVQTDLPAHEAVEAYLAGSLPTGKGFCRCHQ